MAEMRARLCRNEGSALEDQTGTEILPVMAESNVAPNRIGGLLSIKDSMYYAHNMWHPNWALMARFFLHFIRR